MSFRSAGIGAAVLMAGVMVACVETKEIEERLSLFILPSGHMVAKVEVKLPKVDEGTPQGARVAEIRLAALKGVDPWSLRFARMSPLAEHYEWMKAEGALRAVSREALASDVEECNRLLSDTAIRLRSSSGPGFRELAIETGPPMVASADERRRMEEILDLFSEKVASYLAATIAVYRHMGDHPERAEPCFRGMLGNDDDAEHLEAGEAELVAAWGKAGEAAAEMLDLVESHPEDGELTAEQLSSKVFDPFPCEVVVRVPGMVLAQEGFRTLADGALRAPRTRLGTAWLAIEGRWAAPDPVALYLAGRERDVDADVEPETVALLPRHYGEAPTARDVRDALAAALRAPSSIWVRFDPPASPAGAEPPERWWETPAPAPAPALTASSLP